jgi:uncharacterized phage protein (TIGR01671 family)
MREIRFRLFSKKKNKMVNWNDIPKTYNVHVLNDNENNENFSPWMQYTGIKDKNCKEIYEGDFVKRQVFAFGEPRTFIGEVKMFEGCWWIDNGTAAVPVWNELHQIEVIGNIYENPELLEEEE